MDDVEIHVARWVQGGADETRQEQRLKDGAHLHIVSRELGEPRDSVLEAK